MKEREEGDDFRRRVLLVDFLPNALGKNDLSRAERERTAAAENFILGTIKDEQNKEKVMLVFKSKVVFGRMKESSRVSQSKSSRAFLCARKIHR